MSLVTFDSDQGLVWEDMIIWYNSSGVADLPQPVLGQDWDVVNYNPDGGDRSYVVVVSNFSVKKIFSIPGFGWGVHSIKKYTMTPNQRAVINSMSVDICMKKNYASGTNTDCDSIWPSSFVIPDVDADPLIDYGYSMGFDFDHGFIQNEKDKNHCEREKRWGMPCDGRNTSYKPSTCPSNLTSSQKYFHLWDNCCDWGYFQDNRRKFPQVFCGSSACDITQQHVNYYMPPALSSGCHGTGCYDNPELYPTLVPSDSSRCQKRGYDWGVLDANTLFVGKDCKGEFHNYKSNSTTCDGSTDYSFKTCVVSNDLYQNDPSSGAFVPPKCSGLSPVCVNNSDQMTDAVCSDSKYSCPQGYCDNNIKGQKKCYKDDGTTVDRICNQSTNTWYCPDGSSETQPTTDSSGNSSFIFYLILIVALVVIYKMFAPKMFPQSQGQNPAQNLVSV